jgi:hypothetical protein
VVKILPVTRTLGNVEGLVAFVFVGRRRERSFKLVSLLDLVQKIVQVAVNFALLKRIVLIMFGGFLE